MDLNKFKSSQQSEAPQSACLYGAPKAGKTTLAADLVEGYNIIWLDNEKGYQTLFNCVPDHLAHKIKIFPIQDTSGEPNAIKTIGKLFTENRTHRVCWQHGVISCPTCTKNAATDFTEINLYDYSTDTVVVVDSLTQLGDSAMAHALGPVDTFSKKKTEYDHYDRQGLLLKNILNGMKRLNCHVLFISHEEELDQEDGTKKLCPVAGTRNFSRKVGRYFDHLIHLAIKNKSHKVASGTTAEMKVQTGSRNSVQLENGDSILDLFKPKEMKPDAGKKSAQKTGAQVAKSKTAAELLADINAKKAAQSSTESSGDAGDKEAEA